MCERWDTPNFLTLRVQGIGWALNEEYVFTADGTLANGSFLDYRMPRPWTSP